eukprot:4892669-Amphidinium_carterae.1
MPSRTRVAAPVALTVDTLGSQMTILDRFPRDPKNDFAQESVLCWFCAMTQGPHTQTQMHAINAKGAAITTIPAGGARLLTSAQPNSCQTGALVPGLQALLPPSSYRAPGHDLCPAQEC